MLSQRAKVGANQKPLVANRSAVDLVAATTTQYTGTRKYRATTRSRPVTMMSWTGVPGRLGLAGAASPAGDVPASIP